MEDNKRPEIKSPDETVSRIIHSHVLYSMTAAAIPFPLVDIAVITAIQLDMIKQIAMHHGAAYDHEAGKSLISSLVGAALARIGASVVKAIPGVGTLIGMGTQVTLAGAASYALGRVFDCHFSGKGSIFEVDIDSLKRNYQELLKKGQKLASRLQKEKKSEDIPATIEKLKNLKDNGVITETDFEEAKKKLLEKLMR